MRLLSTIIALLLINTIGNTQTFYTSTSGKLREVIIKDSTFTYKDIPVCNGASNIASITRYGDTLYNVAGTTLTSTIIGGNGPCTVLGNFPISGVALTIDKQGLLYYAGAELATYIYTYKSFSETG